MHLGSGNWLSVAAAAPLSAPATRSENLRASLGRTGSINTVRERAVVGEKVRRTCAVTYLPAVAKRCKASMCVIQICPWITAQWAVGPHCCRRWHTLLVAQLQTNHPRPPHTRVFVDSSLSLTDRGRGDGNTRKGDYLGLSFCRETEDKQSRGVVVRGVLA